MGKQYAVGVVSGVLATLIYAVILRPVGGALLTLASSISNSLVSSVYLDAARGQEGMAATLGVVMFLALICGMGTGFSASLLSRLWFRRRRTERHRRRASVMLVATTLVMVILLGGYGAFIVADYNLNTSFSQRMAALGPYISVHDERVLRAMWANMASRDDYLSIVSKMDSMAKAAGASLPKPLVN